MDNKKSYDQFSTSADPMEPYFLNFLNKFSSRNKHSKSWNAEAIASILTSFGSEVYDCKENFCKLDIRVEDLSSISSSDLEKLGIRKAQKRNELLEDFARLPNQDFTLRDIMNLKEFQNANNKIFERCSSYLEHMRLSLLAANLKIKFVSSEDVIVEDRHYASKFVVDAVAELMKITEDIENKLEMLELNSCEHKNWSTIWKTLGLATVISLGILFFVKRY